MKILTFLILICLSNILSAQSKFDSGRISRSFTIIKDLNKANQRSFNIHPDTLSIFFRQVGSTEEEIQEQYFLEYENGQVSKTKFFIELGNLIEITNKYQGDKLIGGDIVLVEGSNILDFGFFTQNFDSKDRMVSSKLYMENELVSGDSLEIAYDGENIVTYIDYSFNEDSEEWLPYDEYTNIKYVNNDIVSYDYNNYIFEEDTSYVTKSRFTEVVFLKDLQQEFFEPLTSGSINFDSTNITYYLSPEDAGYYGYPSPAGYTRADYDEQEDDYINASEQSVAFESDHYNVNIKDINTGEITATDEIYFNNEDKIEKIFLEEGGVLSGNATRLFEYNEHGRLSMAVEHNELNIVTSSATFIYQLNQSDDLEKYTEETYSAGFGTYAYGLILGYKKTAETDNVLIDGLFNSTPNPFNDELKISIPFKNASGVLKVFNYAGIQIDEKRVIADQETATLSTKNYQAGVYFLMLESNGKKFINKVVKI